jgi:putative glutamine amidotransferase
VGICAVIRRVELPFGAVEAHVVFSAYVHAVADAGTVPVVLPCMDGTWAESLVCAVDGVVLTGGPDVAADQARDTAEIAMVHASLAMGRPVLGVCRGLQIVNVALGGSLVPHVEGHLGDSVRHVVDVLPSSGLAAAAGTAQMVTNSLHHQAAGEIGGRLRVTARAADGTVEALESDGPAPVLAVQWHPELDAGPASSAPFAWLAERAEAARCS